MFPEPPDDVRTVFCQTCEAWRHPRHECARSSAHETAPLPILLLRRDGPSTSADYPGTSYEAKRKHGIAKFELTSHSEGKNSVFGHTNPVYYLMHEHRPREVIDTWLTANAETLQGRELTTESITRAISRGPFRDAWQTVREERDLPFLTMADHSERGGDHYGETVCPFCGTTITNFPAHLPCPESDV